MSDLRSTRSSRFSRFTPGLLVAATGVGAGDLLTASMAGAQVGVVLLWTAVIGAVLKWSLTEGVARWQMGSGTTILEGWTFRLGGWLRWIFFAYFFLWSLMVGSALISACGLAGDAFFPLGDPKTSRAVWGILHSLVGLGLVWAGGFRFFERVMGVCIAIMFVTVLVTAILIRPEWGAVLSGLVVPTLPPGGFTWGIGVLGGVGGTVTLLSYGYWIREQKRTGREGLRTSRLDLAVAYAGTGLFGIAMIVIGSQIQLEPGAGDVAIQLADQLQAILGPAGRLLFLVGFWAAVFSSLLGVWQSVPYIFADFFYMKREESPADLKNTTPYRLWLVGIAVLPVIFLWLSVKQIQLAYAVMGALFMPMLALTLLIMNNRGDWVGSAFRNNWRLNLLLVITLGVFLYLGGQKLF